MENSGEQEDDHGSGWLEVKKKHRSSSKFSLQGWVDGLSGKPSARHNQPMVDDKVRKPVVNVSVSSKEGVGFSTKSVANQDVEHACVTPSPSSSSRDMIATSITNGSGSSKEIPQKDSPVMIHNFKRGDIDHGDLERPCDKGVCAHIKFGDIDSDTLSFNWTTENVNSMISPRSLSAEVQAKKMEITSENLDGETHHMHSSTPRSSENKCKELNETSLKSVDKQSEHDGVVDEKGDLSNCIETHHELENLVDVVSLEISDTVTEGIGVPYESKAGDIKSSAETIVDDGSVTMVISEETEVVAVMNGTKIHAEPSIANSVEECKGSRDDVISDDMSRTKMAVDLSGVGDSEESKERFRQRLWSFLFENLSRAVDELYLLCELECDLEQVKEAILVLHEAQSDFKELNARVQEFENVKKSSPQLGDGFSVTTRTGHRRPHALSWEVRRMTTSPHRAEILSSSLEAFKKIQHERANMSVTTGTRILNPDSHHSKHCAENLAGASYVNTNAKIPGMKQMKKNVESGRSSKANIKQDGNGSLHNSADFETRRSRLSLKDTYGVSIPGKMKKEQFGLTSEKDKLPPMKDKMLTDTTREKNPKSIEHLKVSKKDTEKRNTSPWKSMDAWKEKRNWEDILASPFRASSRVSPSPGMSRRSAERKRILRDKLMSPEKKKRTALDLKKDAEEKHARATRIRGELENERVQKLQRSSEKLNRVNEWQAVRNTKLREGMDARHQRSVSRHEAFLAQVVRKAGDESSKVNEVRFITSLNEGNKKIMLRQKHQDSEMRRAEKLQVMKSKQREDMAREEAVLERRKLIETEKLQRLAEIQRKKEEAQVRREEERRLSSVAREAKAIDQLRRKEIRAKMQQEEAELLAQKLAERLRESEQRRKFYLEQIRERASMDFRDQSPLLRRSLNKEVQGRSTPAINGDDMQTSIISSEVTYITNGNITLQHSLKRRIKKIRQKLMALKYEFSEPPANVENSGIGYRTAVGNARAKVARWLQELQKLRQARKEGVAIGLITAEIVKFLDGKDPELLASRQAGLLDFIASALPASHTSKPKACQVTIYFVRVLRTVLSLPVNRSYFLSQNLLPPIIPILSAALENYIKIAASLNVPGGTNTLLSKTAENFEAFEAVTEVLDGLLWIVTIIIGHEMSDERQIQLQDGLLELVVAYQVIHRLRDLFALYDRPQVEGSPFPSSILLSINMLMVLTSRPRTISSIDWESFPSASKPGQDHTLVDSTDVEFSFVSNGNGDCRPPLYVPNGSIVTNLPDVPEDRPLDESSKTNKIDERSSAIESNEFIHNTKETSPTDKSRKNVNYTRSSECEKDEKSYVDSGLQVEKKNENLSTLKQPLIFLLSAISETGLVSLPSLLTAVLLQANNRLSSEQASYVLPLNFEEVAAGVLKVLNNLALIDITLMQKMLARPDLKMEFFHLMSFLLSHCTNKWKVADDQVGLLLLECLLLLGYFALFHPGNQAVLRWGKSPTILHKICDLPFVFFSDPDLMPVLSGTLVAACYGCEQNKGVVQQELSMDMLLSLLKSCKSSSPVVQSRSTRDKMPIEYSRENIHLGFESKKNQVDTPLKSSRYNAKSGTVSSGKDVGSTGNSSRTTKMRNQREGKTMKGFEDKSLKRNLPIPENSDSVMLHCRFPESFIDKAEQFFSASGRNSEDEG